MEQESQQGGCVDGEEEIEAVIAIASKKESAR
jgi:hypothetical protein